MIKKALFIKNDNGVVAIIVAILLIVLLAFSALAIDIGHKYVVRNELQNAADAAALAGARELGRQYDEEDGTITNSLIIAACQQTALQNSSDTDGIAVSGSDVQIGRWDYGYSLSNGINIPNPLTQDGRINAVRVRVQRGAGTANSAIPTFLGDIIGTDTMEEEVVAEAALFGVPVSGTPLPIGISEKWFDGSNPCGEVIQFYPTKDSCAAWHVYENYPASDAKLRGDVLKPMLSALQAGTFEVPEAIAYKSRYNFIGGTLSTQTFDTFDQIFQIARLINDSEKDKPIDGDSDNETWTANLPVYSEPGDDPCSNLGPDTQEGGTLIVGFAKVVFRMIGEAPNKVMTATVVCDVLAQPGSTEDFGLLGAIPKLIQ